MHMKYFTHQVHRPKKSLQECTSINNRNKNPQSNKFEFEHWFHSDRILLHLLTGVQFEILI